MADNQADAEPKPADDSADQLLEEEKEYERLFANRYTEEDPYYAKTKDLPDPPCIFPWFGRPKRVFDFARQGNRREEQDSNRQGDRDSWRHRRDSPGNSGDRDRSNQRRDWNDDRRPYDRRNFSRNDRGGGYRGQWHNRPRDDDRDRGPRGDRNGGQSSKRPSDGGDRPDDSKRPKNN